LLNHVTKFFFTQLTRNKEKKQPYQNNSQNSINTYATKKEQPEKQVSCNTKAVATQKKTTRKNHLQQKQQRQKRRQTMPKTNVLPKQQK